MRLWAVLLVFTAGLLCGCKHSAQTDDSAQPPSPSVRAARNEQITPLENELYLRDKQIEELRARNDLLSERVKKLEFLNEQLREQLKAVGDAPRQRDLYKQQATENQLQIGRLQRQIKELKRAMGVPTSHPTTAPVAGDD